MCSNVSFQLKCRTQHNWDAGMWGGLTFSVDWPWRRVKLFKFLRKSIVTDVNARFQSFCHNFEGAFFKFPPLNNLWFKFDIHVVYFTMMRKNVPTGARQWLNCIRPFSYRPHFGWKFHFDLLLSINANWINWRIVTADTAVWWADILLWQRWRCLCGDYGNCDLSISIKPLNQ